jgi:hypothetical protein
MGDKRAIRTWLAARHDEQLFRQIHEPTWASDEKRGGMDSPPGVALQTRAGLTLYQRLHTARGVQHRRCFLAQWYFNEPYCGNPQLYNDVCDASRDIHTSPFGCSHPPPITIIDVQVWSAECSIEAQLTKGQAAYP